MRSAVRAELQSIITSQKSHSRATTIGVSAVALADANQPCPHALEFSSPTNSQIFVTQFGRCTWVRERTMDSGYYEWRPKLVQVAKDGSMDGGCWEMRSVWVQACAAPPRGKVTLFFNDPQAYATLHHSLGDYPLGTHEAHVIRYGLPVGVGIEQQHLNQVKSRRLIADIENNGMNASKFSVYSDSPIVVKRKRYGWLARWWHTIPNVERGYLKEVMNDVNCVRKNLEKQYHMARQQSHEQIHGYSLFRHRTMP